MIKTCKILLHPNNEQRKILKQWMVAQSIVDKELCHYWNVYKRNPTYKELKETCKDKIKEQYVNEVYYIFYSFNGYERSRYSRNKEARKILTERIKKYKEENNIDRNLTNEEIKPLYLPNEEYLQLGEINEDRNRLIINSFRNTRVRVIDERLVVFPLGRQLGDKRQSNKEGKVPKDYKGIIRFSRKEFGEKTKGAVKFGLVSLKQERNRFYMILPFEVEEEAVNLNKNKTIGLDLGMMENRTVIMSNGEVLNFTNESDTHIKAFNKHYNKMTALKSHYDKIYKGKNTRRAKKNWKNYEITKSKTNNCKKYIINAFSKQLVDEYDYIGIEKNSVQQMQKKNKKKYANKWIQKYSIRKIIERIKQKAAEKGKVVHEIESYRAASRYCSSCGTKLIIGNKYTNGDELSKEDENLFLKRGSPPSSYHEPYCIKCNKTYDRDINAAKNIENWMISDLALC